MCIRGSGDVGGECIGRRRIRRVCEMGVIEIDQESVFSPIPFLCLPEQGCKFP